MHFVSYSLASALLLGVYDVCQKHAVRGNAVVPVLFFSTLTGASIWLVLLALQALAPAAYPAWLGVRPLSLLEHGELALKALIVGASWLFTYLAMKHLPISLAAPIRATSPLWTLGGALAFLGERPSRLQLLGIATTLGSFFALALAGRREGVHFHRDRWVGFMVVGTWFGALSSLYDKLLLGQRHLPPAAVQAWFSIYLLVMFSPLALFWWRSRRRERSLAQPVTERAWAGGSFEFRPSILGLAVCLLLADFAYFSALAEPGGLISLVASLRRGSTLVAFAVGLWLFKEPHGLRKLPAVLGIVVGIALTIW